MWKLCLCTRCNFAVVHISVHRCKNQSFAMGAHWPLPVSKAKGGGRTQDAGVDPHVIVVGFHGAQVKEHQRSGRIDESDGVTITSRSHNLKLLSISYDTLKPLVPCVEGISDQPKADAVRN
jgi:hypothetical protein